MNDRWLTRMIVYGRFADARKNPDLRLRVERPPHTTRSPSFITRIIRESYISALQQEEPLLWPADILLSARKRILRR